MKARKAARVTAIEVSAATEACNRVGMSQSEFAKLLGVSVRTLQDWEQGRREPSGAAKNLAAHCVAEPGGSQGSGLSESRGLSLSYAENGDTSIRRPANRGPAS